MKYEGFCDPSVTRGSPGGFYGLKCEGKKSYREELQRVYLTRKQVTHSKG